MDAIRTQMIGLIAVIVIILTGIGVMAQRTRPLSWRYTTALTREGVSEILNTIPLDRALEAKVIVEWPPRKEGSTLVSPYVIYYRD